MLKSILLEIIRSLSPKEQRELHKWLASPAHNHRKDVGSLFDYLLRYQHDSEVFLEKEAIWKHLFPTEPFDDAFLRQVIFFLNKCIEEYLVWHDVRENHVQTQTSLMRVFRTRGLERNFRQTMDALQKKMSQQPLRNAQHMRDEYDVALEQYLYTVSHNWSTDLHLQETSDALDIAFVSDRLRVAALMLSHAKIYKKINYDFGMVEATLRYVEERQLYRIPGVAVYYHHYKSATSGEQEHFEALVEILFNKANLFKTNELREFYLAAINYCIPKINAGDQYFAQRVHELFRNGIENGILMENSLLSRTTFGNAVAAAIRVKEFEWAEAFIEKYTPYIEEKYRKSTVHLYLSRLYFEKGDYNQAQRLLREFEYDDLLFNIIAKTMLLKIYYEEDEYDAFGSLLESMRTYLQRKEALDQTRKTAYKNMISLMKKLLNLNPYSKSQKEQLREKVKTTQPLMERDWILNQLK
jgi:hypothetical protein